MSLFSPDEKVLISGKGSIEQPIRGSGELYLTERRLFLVHKSGLIAKRETPLLDVNVQDISYVKVEGTLNKVLVLGVKANGGQILAYKIHISTPESWSAQIFSLKGGSSTIRSTPAKQSQPAASPPQGVQPPTTGLQSAPNPNPHKYCSSCGNEVASSVKYCPHCGKFLNYGE